MSVQRNLRRPQGCQMCGFFSELQAEFGFSHFPEDFRALRDGGFRMPK